MGSDDIAGEVRDNAAQSRFEIYVGDRRAGFLQYDVLDEQRVDFLHTEVDGEFEGKGLASQLIIAALDEARQRGWHVVPTCPFVARYVGRHREYQDLIAR